MCLILLNGVQISAQITDGLVCYYRFISDAKDSSIYGNDGILYPDATANGFLHIPYDNHSFLAVPFNTMNQLGDFSVACWVRMNAFQFQGSDDMNTILSGFKGYNLP
jgi:hypothetical protein